LQIGSEIFCETELGACMNRKERCGSVATNAGSFPRGNSFVGSIMPNHKNVRRHPLRLQSMDTNAIVSQPSLNVFVGRKDTVPLDSLVVALNWISGVKPGVKARRSIA
jgi:hypothetical protein